MSAGGVVFQEVVINDDDAVMMMLQFLSDNQVRLAEVYVETEALGESHSHQYSYDDGFAGGYEWGGSSSNYQGGGYTGGYGEGGGSINYGGSSSAGWDQYSQPPKPAPFVEADGVQWPAWGPEWYGIENTIRSGGTSHEREDDVGDRGHVDPSSSSYPFESSDEDTEEDLISVSEEEEDTDDNEDEAAFREAPTPYYTQVPTQFLHSQKDPPDFVPMPVYNPTANLEVGMAFTSKDAVQDAFTEEALRRNFEWKVKYSDSKQLHVICKHDAEGCTWQLRAANMKRKGAWVIRKAETIHTCSSSILSQDHRQLKAKKVGRTIKHLIEGSTFLHDKVQKSMAW
ncbi:unnamed protein product [Linum trigynum]|uniref:Transposase MuDR plant domain-containing protein n=1 Tax=Linum trigynum TaxID=586398 RepID=A0AAV2GI54_9ROSI